MSELVAVVAGASAASVVLLVGAAARRPIRRVLPDAEGRPPPRRRRPSAAGRLVVGLVGLAAGAAVAGPLPVAVATGGFLVLHRRHRRTAVVAERRSTEAAMPDAVELLVLCIEAGCSPRQAVVEVAARAPPAVRPAFVEVERWLHRGRSLADALDALAPATGPLGRDVAVAIATADRGGLPLAPALERLSTDARAVRRRLADADARRLPVRLTFPLVLCTLPSFVLLAIAPAVLGALSTLRGDGP